MSRSSLLNFLFLAVALSFTTATPCSAPEVTFAGGDRLQPGQKIRITWSLLPPDTEEFELLLKCESPFVFKIRLTECKDPGLDSLVWVVPRIPCERARLLLRRGEGGKEIDWAWSRPFSIRGGLCAPVQRTAYYRGEMWATDETLCSLWDDRSGDMKQREAQSGLNDFRSSTDDSAQPPAKERHPGLSGRTGKPDSRERPASERTPMKLVLRL